MAVVTMQTFPADHLQALAEAACIASGASAAMARSLVAASLSADWVGRHEVGLAHMLDYLDALREGRIDGEAKPVITRPAGAVISADARGGIAQLAFDLAFDDLQGLARNLGIAIFVLRGSYPAGELGYYVRRLAEAGLVAMAWTNAHAMLAVEGCAQPVFSTNPMAFAATRGDKPALVIDQASSATAYVNVARAASQGRSIPLGWAQDAQRQPTTDPAQAILGAMLPFGGYKGANIALMVEVMAGGLAGANWSLDVGHFASGDHLPGAGLSVVAMAPGLCAPDFEARLNTQIERLQGLGLHIPGGGAPDAPFGPASRIPVEADIYARLVAAS